MTCFIGSNELTQYVLGDAEPAIEQRIREHLEGGCDSCAATMSRLSSFSNLLNQATADVSERSGVWKSVEAEVSSQIDRKVSLGLAPPDRSLSAVKRESSHPDRGTSWSIGLGVLLATACSFLLVAFALHASKSLDRLARHPVKQDLSIEGFAKTENDSTRRVSMRRKGSSAEQQGSFLVDRLSRQLHLYTVGWQQLAPQQRFVIWFVTADETIIEGDHLESSNVEKKLHLIDLPDTNSPIVSIAVTVEQDSDWSTHQKQPAMAAGSKLDSASFVSDRFDDLLRRNI